MVIAHRLFTIRHCDRIRYLENGTYDDLIAQGGNFSRLVERQRLDQ